MMLLVEQPINHEYAHPPSFRNQSEYYCQKQKIPANFSTISSTINTTHLQYTSQGAPTYPFLQIVIVCISAPPGPFWSCLHQKNTISYKFFGFTKTDLYIKTHFKTTGRKSLYIPSRTNLRLYYLRVSTLTANKSPTIYGSSPLP